MTVYDVSEWEKIQDDFSDCLLLGNGASIAVDHRFSYRSLLDEARTSTLISDQIEHLFQHFQTEDFEHILRMLWNTYQVNQALAIDEQITTQAYDETRNALIKVVRRIHVSFEETNSRLNTITTFLRHFNTIITLNYDLIVYWAILLANELDPTVKFKDCFVHGEFDFDWKRFRDPIRPAVKSVLVFYPHGSLALTTNLIGQTRKISRHNFNEYLIDRILSEWQTGSVIPLFVSEGDSIQKRNAILRNGYLNTISREVLPEKKDSAVIYGWSMSDNDEHILQAILESGVRRLGISVYVADRHWQDYCHRVDRKIRDTVESGRNINIVFFDSASAGCWCNPMLNP